MYNNILQQQMAMMLQNQIQQQQLFMQQQFFQSQLMPQEQTNANEESCSNSEDEDDADKRTLFVANLDEQVTEELLYELFLQAGPLESVRIPKDNAGKQRTFGFVEYVHKCTIPYALELYDGLTLFRKSVTIKTKNGDTRQSYHAKQRDSLNEVSFHNPQHNSMLPLNHNSDSRYQRRSNEHANDRDYNWGRDRERERERDYEHRYDRQRRQNYSSSRSNRHSDKRHNSHRR